MAVDTFTASDRFGEKGMSDETVGDDTILVLRQRIFDPSWRLVH